MKLITTSWDDGYPSDHRIADVLDKYNLRGTFYIPKRNEEYAVMPEEDIVALSKRHEIGGHTINHVRVRGSSELLFEKEIKGSFEWLSEITGVAPLSFCFPGGVFNQHAAKYTLQAGYKIIRTTELLTTKVQTSNFIIPTTLQVYQHTSLQYWKNLFKRAQFDSMAVYLRSSSNTNLLKLVDYYVEFVLKHNGCFHLWGHSWELDENGLWGQLDSICRLLSNIPEFTPVTNGELVQYIETPTP